MIASGATSCDGYFCRIGVGVSCPGCLAKFDAEMSAGGARVTAW
jgi:hypothetical protein